MKVLHQNYGGTIHSWVCVALITQTVKGVQVIPQAIFGILSEIPIKEIWAKV
jgi:hypothetical protein